MDSGTLAAQQKLLVHLATQPSALAEFCQDPVSFGAEFGLEPAQSLAIAQIAPALASYSHSLVNKRLRVAKKILPQSSRFLGAEFDSKFREFAPGVHLEGTNRHRDDAWLFTEFLLDHLPKGTARQLVRSERFGLEPYYSRRSFGVAILGASHTVGFWWRGRSVKFRFFRLPF